MIVAAILELVVKTPERNATAKHLDEIKWMTISNPLGFV